MKSCFVDLLNLLENNKEIFDEFRTKRTLNETFEFTSKIVGGHTKEELKEFLRFLIRDCKKERNYLKNHLQNHKESFYETDRNNQNTHEKILKDDDKALDETTGGFYNNNLYGVHNGIYYFLDDDNGENDFWLNAGIALLAGTTIGSVIGGILARYYFSRRKKEEIEKNKNKQKPHQREN